MTVIFATEFSTASNGSFLLALALEISDQVRNLRLFAFLDFSFSAYLLASKMFQRKENDIMDHFSSRIRGVTEKSMLFYSFHLSKCTTSKVASKYLTPSLHVDLKSPANIFFSKSNYIQKEDGSLKFVNTEHVSSLHDNCQMSNCQMIFVTDDSQTLRIVGNENHQRLFRFCKIC